MKLPEGFEHRMKHQIGEAYPEFVSALNLNPPVSVRINPKKILAPLTQLERVAWCANGYYLDKRPLFSSDPLWHCGAYYVQEASSMSIERAFLKVREQLGKGIKVLDLCAAPGGKSTHLASLLENDDLLVSNEVIRSRVPVLVENISKHGYSNCIITNSDSADFVDSGAVFDMVLVDAPCSGEGLFRKDPDAVNEWNDENVQTCELRQKRILANIHQCVKPGGFLIYSTCTYNPGENQAQIEELIQSGFERIEFEINQSIVSEIQFMPHLYKGEGFFMCLLRRKSEAATEMRKNKNSIRTIKKDTQFEQLTLSEGEFIEHRKTIYQVRAHVIDFFNHHLFQLNLVQMGTPIGTLQDKLFQVSGFLPFSLDIQANAFQIFELDQRQALEYLAKNAIITSERNKKGYVLLQYKSQWIGLGKYAGNRINNLFRNEWRLRRIATPEEYFNLTV